MKKLSRAQTEILDALKAESTAMLCDDGQRASLTWQDEQGAWQKRTIRYKSLLALLEHGAVQEEGTTYCGIEFYCLPMVIEPTPVEEPAQDFALADLKEAPTRTTFYDPSDWMDTLLTNENDEARDEREFERYGILDSTVHPVRCGIERMRADAAGIGTWELPEASDNDTSMTMRMHVEDGIVVDASVYIAYAREQEHRRQITEFENFQNTEATKKEEARALQRNRHAGRSTANYISDEFWAELGDEFMYRILKDVMKEPNNKQEETQ
jgi:hypothetical protein